MSEISLTNMYIGILIGCSAFFPVFIFIVIDWICCPDGENCFKTLLGLLAKAVVYTAPFAAVFGFIINWAVTLSACVTVCILSPLAWCFVKYQSNLCDAYKATHHTEKRTKPKRFNQEIWNFLKSIDRDMEYLYYDGFIWKLQIGTVDQVMKLTEQDLRTDLSMKQEHIDAIMKKICSLKAPKLVFGYIQEIERKYDLNGVVPQSTMLICLDYYMKMEKDHKNHLLH